MIFKHCSCYTGLTACSYLIQVWIVSINETIAIIQYYLNKIRNPTSVPLEIILQFCIHLVEYYLMTDFNISNVTILLKTNYSDNHILYQSISGSYFHRKGWEQGTSQRYLLYSYSRSTNDYHAGHWKGSEKAVKRHWKGTEKAPKGTEKAIDMTMSLDGVKLVVDVNFKPYFPYGLMLNDVSIDSICLVDGYISICDIGRCRLRWE